MGTLFVVSTPIGNLEDITLRAIRVLKEADIVAAEDTSHSIKLLNHFGIIAKLVSYHDHNKNVKADILVEHLKNGMNVALITDAGTPCVSDPGYLIVKKCREEGLLVVPIPGVSAPITALSASGFPTDNFSFVGFLSSQETRKREELLAIIESNQTTIFFDSPHRIIKTLEMLGELLPNGKVLVAKELTKIHEYFFIGTPLELVKMIEPEYIKGEFTLIVSKSPKEEAREVSIDTFKTEIEQMRSRGEGTKNIAQYLAIKFKLTKKKAYNLVLQAMSHSATADNIDRLTEVRKNDSNNLSG